MKTITLTAVAMLSPSFMLNALFNFPGPIEIVFKSGKIVSCSGGSWTEDNSIICKHGEAKPDEYFNASAVFVIHNVKLKTKL